MYVCVCVCAAVLSEREGCAYVGVADDLAEAFVETSDGVDTGAEDARPSDSVAEPLYIDGVAEPRGYRCWRRDSRRWESVMSSVSA